LVKNASIQIEIFMVAFLFLKKIMKKISEREYKYQAVIKELVKRYIMRKQQRDLNAGVTEDDLNEIKQDISGLR
jgi:transient receptor potential cation channel subfamily C protein 4